LQPGQDAERLQQVNVSAQFPGSVWDGTSKTRSVNDVSQNTIAPTGPDCDQMTAELIAANTKVKSNGTHGAWTSVAAASDSWKGTIKYRQNASGSIFL